MQTSAHSCKRQLAISAPAGPHPIRGDGHSTRFSESGGVLNEGAGPSAQPDRLKVYRLQSECLHGSDLRFSVEDRIDVLHDVRTDLQKRPFVLDRYQRALGAVVHRHPERLHQRA
jgi:hypothetical protein